MSTGEVGSGNPESGGNGRGAVAFAPEDDALFDIDAVVPTTRDVRSVGEVLVDVDHQARQLLIDVDGDAAAGLVRGWMPLTQAAAALWEALPANESRYGPPPPGSLTVVRMAAHAAANADSVARGWPGPGVPDARLVDNTSDLQRAAALVRRYGAEIPTVGQEASDDLDAVRTRLVHGLYITAHAIGVAILAHGHDLFVQHRDDRRPVLLSATRTPYAVKPLGEWVDRMAAAEILGQQYLSDRYPATVTGAATESLDPGRVARALAGWDIQAHRTLARDPSPVNVVLIARVQALQTGVAHLLVGATESMGEESSQDGQQNVLVRPMPKRLTNALHRSGRAWHALASRWDDLPAPTDRPDPALLRATAETRVAFRTITHGDTGLIQPSDMAERPDFIASLRAILTSLQTAPEMAEAIGTRACQRGLVGRARALSRRANNDVDKGIARPPSTDPDAVWVSPGDILAKRLVPIPEPVARGLQRSSRSAVAASVRVAAAAAVAAPPPSNHPGIAQQHPAARTPGRPATPVATRAGLPSLGPA